MILNFNFNLRKRNGFHFYHKFLDETMYLNSLFNKSCSVCVCRSSIIFLFMLNLVNLLGVSLENWSKSHRRVFHIDLY